MNRYLDKQFDKQELLARIGDISQLAGIQSCVFDDGKSRGVRAFHVSNGGGLSYWVLPGRGMDLGQVFYRGVPLTFASGTGITSPAYYEEPGRKWLRSFFGGFLTTCGLSSAGTPNCDRGEELGLNGRAANADAEDISIRQAWKDDLYTLELRGSIREASFTGEHLVSTRTISTEFGSKTITIKDVVENRGFEPTPIMLIYHMNFGFPLLAPGAEVLLPSRKVTPFDTGSAEKLSAGSWSTFEEPGLGAERLLVMHDVASDAEGRSFYALWNPDIGDGSPLGIRIGYSTIEMPEATQLKLMRSGCYITTFEPGTVTLHGRAALREGGRLPMLPGLAYREFSLEITIMDSSADFERAKTDLEKLLGVP